MSSPVPVRGIDVGEAFGKIYFSVCSGRSYAANHDAIPLLTALICPLHWTIIKIVEQKRTLQTSMLIPCKSEVSCSSYARQTPSKDNSSGRGGAPVITSVDATLFARHMQLADLLGLLRSKVRRSHADQVCTPPSLQIPDTSHPTESHLRVNHRRASRKDHGGKE